MSLQDAMNYLAEKAQQSAAKSKVKAEAKKKEGTL
jgi:hypothetical protein